MFEETFDDSFYTGKYTQTLSDYMKARDLNPFEESDRIEAIESLGGVKYGSVPVGVMDNLFNKIALRYMFNEFGTMSVDVFRLQLMSYFSDKESWYSKMFDLYSDLLPYDMLDESITTEGGETSDRTSNKNTTKNTSGEAKTVSAQTDDSEDTSTTTTTSDETTTLNGETVVNGQRGNTNTNTATTTKGIEEEKSTNEKVVKGVGDVDSLTNPDVSVEGTNFVERTETTKPSLGEDKTVTVDGGSDTINDTTTTTDTTGKTGGGSSNTVNGGLRTTNKQDDDTHSGTESGTDLTTEGGEVNRNETVLKSGRVEWKPELARKFYEVYIGVDSEFIDGMRELFTVIY